MFKRVFLFLLTNIMVITTISIIIHLLGLNSYLTAKGIDYKTLAIFCAIWGSAGAFISLLMSRYVAKTAMGVQVIDPNTATGSERDLLNIIQDLIQRAKIPTMPEVGIYNSPELNAFATGPSKSRALVAVSSGLLNSMNRDQIYGVLGHEITHIANGDMVTMTMLQGIVNAFAMFLSRIVAYAIATTTRGDEREDFSPMLFYVLTFVFDIAFTLLGSIVVAAFSRYREYRADAGGAELAGRNNMISALKALQAKYEGEDDTRAPSLAALKISHKSSWLSLLSSHPPLDKRIARLEQQAVTR